MKKLLIPNGSSSEIMLIQAAKRLGYYVITSGNNPGLIGHQYADEYCPADFSDKEAMLRLAESKKIDAICGNANDIGLLTSIYIAEKMNLPGVRDQYVVSRIFHEKDLFKQFIGKLGLPTPQSRTFDSANEANNYLKEVDYPVMVKPVDLSAGRGCREAHDYDEGVSAVNYAFQASKVKRIVIEEYLPGRQYDFHTLIIDEKVRFYSASNEYSFKNPYQVSCLTIPGDHSSTVSDILIDEINKMASELHIADGPLWVQYRIKTGVPYIIESARRCGGNNMLDILSRGYSFDFAEWYVRIETGLEYDKLINPLQHNKCQGYLSLMAPRNGCISGIQVSDELREHIYNEYYWYQDGEEVDDYLYSRYGILLFEYDDEEQLANAANQINELAYIKMK